MDPSPADADELEFQALYEKFFKLSATGRDTSQAQADFTALMSKLNSSTTTIEQYVNQIKTLSGALTIGDGAMISVQIDLFIESQTKLIKSQLGLENFDIDPDILDDPEFSEFLAMYSAFLVEIKEVKSNSGSAFEYFTTKVNKKYSKLLKGTIKASKKAIDKKSVPSEY